MKHFFADASLGTIGLIFFFVFFCAAVAWTFRPGAKGQYKQHGDIPLNDDDDKTQE